MTAHALAGEREKCLSRGMNEYISKPIKEQELFDLISQFGLGEEQKDVANELQNSQFQYLDLTYMRSLSAGDTGFEKTVTEQFIFNLPTHLSELKSAYENNDFALVRLIAHDLKTTVSIMGFLPLVEERLDLLETATQKSIELNKVLDELSDLFAIALNEAKTVLQKF